MRDILSKRSGLSIKLFKILKIKKVSMYKQLNDDEKCELKDDIIYNDVEMAEKYSIFVKEEKNSKIIIVEDNFVNIHTVKFSETSVENITTETNSIIKDENKHLNCNLNYNVINYDYINTGKDQIYYSDGTISQIKIPECGYETYNKNHEDKIKKNEENNHELTNLKIKYQKTTFELNLNEQTFNCKPSI
ncbi:uncharacterized protein LOC126894807 isoform X3 [Daktulosphaira vitifoliae]|uniref:uncharacterized protein LOC126894807 isoform X3 n=1 Tax=Daktulosphaira vitifoliae TaxID=58002 RepID=UPI0021A9786B|nr:uncharacterized protein LOC126894807 isoform X3 [Daktulosphaira vitifoliae]